MPGTYGLRTLREGVLRESLDVLRQDDELRTLASRPNGLLEVVDKVLPDLESDERRFLEEIPLHLREAVRAVIVSVADEDGTEIDLQFEPDFKFGVQVYQFDRSVVVRVTAPHA